MLIFKKAQSSDIQLIRQLAHNIWHQHYSDILSLQQISYMLDIMYSPEKISHEIDDMVNWLLLKVENRAIGFLSYQHEIEKNAIKIHKLYLLREFQGKGYGKQALEYVKKEANTLLVKYIYLHVNKKNFKAIKVYEKFGFYIHHADVFDIGNGYVMDDYIMYLDII